MYFLFKGNSLIIDEESRTNIQHFREYSLKLKPLCNVEVFKLQKLKKKIRGFQGNICTTFL